MHSPTQPLITSAPPHILLIDNHDSFTHLLGDLIWRAVGISPTILPNNSPDLTASTLDNADLIVISPGPGHPGVAEDIGASTLAVQQETTPVIGVCLGHQAIALEAGARVERATAPMHGLASNVIHNSTGMFEGISSPMRVIRYHSLDVTLDADSDAPLEVLARADDGTIMALRRTDRPHWGVQFHPESIGTAAGERLMHNLIEAAGVLRTPLWHRAELEYSPHPTAVATLWAEHYPYVCWLDTATDPSGTHIIAAGHTLVHPVDIPPGHLTPDSAETALNFIPGALGALRYEATGGWDGALPPHVDSEEKLLVPEVVLQYECGRCFLMQRAGIDAAPPPLPSHSEEVTPTGPVDAGPITLRHSREEYVALVRRCQEFIDRGESYELCLTTSASAPVTGLTTPADVLDLYLRLRSVAPAPMAGLWLTPDYAVLSSSPERCVQVRDGLVTASPIKGTRPRGATAEEDAALKAELQHSVKDRAENLMIVDLLRNDLARSCLPGSVSVPELCEVYTFSRVHQMISTIQGRLPHAATPMQSLGAVLAAFPGGSMTGAPKQRSMDILAELEAAPRGFYSGCLGYVSANGDVDFNILIRTAVVQDAVVHYGAGGAVTRLSDADAEYEEVLVKMLPLRLVLEASEDL
jgi:hypothetical protein